MTKDLEETLNALPDGCRAAVMRLKAAREVEPCRCVLPVRGPCGGFFARPLLAAASLLAVLFLGSVFFRQPETDRPEAPSRVPREYALADSPDESAMRELVRTQRADGSWANDFLTRRNAAALKAYPDACAQVAYRKAMRNLRVRGLL